MESNKNQIIQVNNSLANFERQITIGEKLLCLKIINFEREKIRNFLISIIQTRNKDTFIRYLSEIYPISNELIEKHQDVLIWHYLSSNTKVIFSADLINKYSSKWDFCNLARNKNVDWNIGMVDKYNDRPGIDWWDTIDGWLTAFPWSSNFIELYGDRLNWNNFSSYQSFPWNEKFIENYALQINWKSLSINEAVPWSVNFIEKYKDKLNWEYLSCNNKLPWSIDFFNKYIDYWDWDGLSQNEEIPWSEDFIYKVLEFG
jgi:hypothetical protein